MIRSYRVVCLFCMALFCLAGPAGAETLVYPAPALDSGGTLVAIAGEGVFFGSDQKAVAFREWLDTHEADVEALEGGTFNDNALLAQTSANARLIMLRK